MLDYRRLGKQRVEAMQLINGLQKLDGRNAGTPVRERTHPAVMPGGSGWLNHPASKMWRGHIGALMRYHDTAIDEWVSRGYKNNMLKYFSEGDWADLRYPSWLGNEEFHASHRSALLYKNPEWYGQFGWTEEPGIPKETYIWPLP